MPTETIVVQNYGVDIFTARSKSVSGGIGYARWADSSYFSAYTNNGGVGLNGGCFYVSSFFLNKGNNAEKWNHISKSYIIIKSIKASITFSSVGSYITNDFSMGKKSNSSTDSWGAVSVIKQVKRSSKSQTSIVDIDLGTELPPSGAYIIGQLNYEGSGNAFPVSKFEIVVTYEYSSIIHVYQGGKPVDGIVYVYHGGKPRIGIVYIYKNGVPYPTG